MGRGTSLLLLLAACKFSGSSGAPATDGDLDDDAGLDGATDSALDAPDGGLTTMVTPPGGVPATILWWLAADHAGFATDASPVDRWRDLGPRTLDAVASPGLTPEWRASSMNFNPAIAFASDHLQTTTSVFPVGQPLDNVSLYLVFADSSDDSFDWVLYEGTLGFDRFSVSRSYSQTTRTDVDLTTDNRLSTTEIPTADLFSATWKTSAPRGELYRNGTVADTASTFTSYTPTGQPMEIGDHFGAAGSDASNNPFDGRIAEIYLIASPLTDAERKRIDTYFALKYGLTMPGNYIASDGTIVWPVNTTYAKDLAAIGRDGMLDQKQGRGATARNLLSIGATTLAVSNAANPTQLAERTFLVWGHDNGALTWATSPRPAGVVRRLVRQWRVVETGAIGVTQIRVPDDSATANGEELPPETAGIALLVDDDPDLSDATVVPMTRAGDQWLATHDFSGTSYISFGDL